MKNDILKTVVSVEEIDNICKRLGAQISEDYKDKKPVVIGLLKGCLPFMSDLLKYITTYVTLDYMSVSSYNGGTSSTGAITIKRDIESNVEGKDIIIVDDIIDTAITLTNIVEHFKKKNVKSVRICTLLDKPSGRVVPLVPDYAGTIIPNEFVVGYGLDYKGFYRNLPFVGVLKEEVYKK